MPVPYWTFSTIWANRQRKRRRPLRPRRLEPRPVVVTAASMGPSIVWLSRRSPSRKRIWEHYKRTDRKRTTIIWVRDNLMASSGLIQWPIFYLLLQLRGGGGSISMIASKNWARSFQNNMISEWHSILGLDYSSVIWCQWNINILLNWHLRRV